MASFVWVTRGWKKLDTGPQQLSRVTMAKKNKTVEKFFGVSTILLNQMKSYETFNKLIERDLNYIWLEALKRYYLKVLDFDDGRVVSTSLKVVMIHWSNRTSFYTGLRTLIGMHRAHFQKLI
jgi:hypothetical protein